MAKKSYTYAQLEAIVTEMRANKLVSHYYEYDYHSAVGPNGEVIDIAKEFPAPRTSGLGWPIDEASYVGMATGAGMTGVISVLRFPSMTSLFNVEQYFNQLGKLRHMTGGQASMPVVSWQQMAGRTYGRAGGSAQQHTDVGEEAVFAYMPGQIVVAPRNAYNAKGLLVSAMRAGDPVMYMDYSEMKAGDQPDVPDGNYTVPLGKADVVVPGKGPNGLCIIAWAPAIMEVLKAVPDLQKAGMDVEVVDPVTIKPYDEAGILASAKKMGRVLVVEHGHWTCGFGAQVVSDIALQAPGIKMKRISWPDAPEPFASSMAAWMRPDAPKIINAANQVMKL